MLSGRGETGFGLLMKVLKVVIIGLNKKQEESAMEKRISEKLLSDYREHLIREEKSPATVEKYLRDAGTFVVYANGKAVSKELLIAYKQHLVEQNYAVRSVNSMLASLNSLMEFMGWRECRVKSLRCQRSAYCTEDKELTKAEYRKLLNASQTSQRLNLVLRTICATGIRVSELKYFTLEAVDRGEISVKCKNKTRTILIPGDLRKLLLRYSKRQGIRSGQIFVTASGKSLDRSFIWAQMKKLCRTAGVNPTKVFPHNLRKLFARTFYAASKDIAKLADILGHSSIETTRIYIMQTGREHRRQIERLNLTLAEYCP